MQTQVTGTPDSSSLIVMMNRIMSRHSRKIARELATLGVNIHAARVLARLLGAESRRCRELARACGLDATTLSHVLGALDKSALITRKRVEADARAVEVSLTEAGRLTAIRCRAIERAYEKTLVESLPRHEIDRVSKLLAQMDRADA